MPLAPNDETGERDHRPAGQRRVEALTQVCQRSSAIDADTTGGADGAAGASSALHVTIALTDLEQRTGCGEVLGSTATGTVLSPEILRRISCDAALVPHVLGTAGEDLDLGRVTRLFTRAQRRRLLRRDRCCTYPGCTAPATWSRAHHVVHWADGGLSDIDNAALLCQRHHTLVHRRRLIASVLKKPDELGRYVVWDLTEGSYDRHLERLRAERSANDPPPLTPERLRSLVEAIRADDPDEQRWARYELEDAMTRADLGGRRGSRRDPCRPDLVRSALRGPRRPGLTPRSGEHDRSSPAEDADPVRPDSRHHRHGATAPRRHGGTAAHRHCATAALRHSITFMLATSQRHGRTVGPGLAAGPTSPTS